MIGFHLGVKEFQKLYLEAYKVHHGWEDFTIVRPANIFGEYDNFGEGANCNRSNL